MTQEAKQDWKDIIHRCFRCGYCKFTFNFGDLNCPSYKKYRFESYSSGGRMWTIYSLLNGEIEWDAAAADVLYACSTCGNCMENCRFDKFNHYLVDFIEAGRAEAVKAGFCPERQKAIHDRTVNENMYNPYGEKNSDNSKLKEQYELPDQAEWVYFIGCTSNYRQNSLRDATLRFLKKAGIEFTLIDERCCGSPLIRTGQIGPVEELMNYNVDQIKQAGASKVITSCAGCYRTLKEDFPKHGVDHQLEIVHTAELLHRLLSEGRLEITSELEATITYHDPCHLGRHSGVYEPPREVYKKIPGVKLVEMRRNRENAWCCGAGGGVKIGYPEWAVEISKERLEEAKQTGATILSSTCPFCKTNLSDANDKFDMGFQVMDLIEIMDQLEVTIKNEK